MPVLCNSFVTALAKKGRNKKNKKKYIQKARLFSLCTDRGFGRLQPTPCLSRDTANISQLSMESCTKSIKGYKEQLGREQERVYMVNTHMCYCVGSGLR